MTIICQFTGFQTYSTGPLVVSSAPSTGMIVPIGGRIFGNGISANAVIYDIANSTQSNIVSQYGTELCLNTGAEPFSITTVYVVSNDITPYPISGLQATGTLGQFSCDATTLRVGMAFAVYGGQAFRGVQAASSQGANGTFGTTSPQGGYGGNFGGGGGGGSSFAQGGYGGAGAVRIIWGSGRSFPSACDDSYSGGVAQQATFYGYGTSIGPGASTGTYVPFSYPNFPTYSFTWTCPVGVTSICILAVGGGGAGVGTNPYGNPGGGGGALQYYNNYSVTPGQVYTVVAGCGGIPFGAYGGGTSYFGDGSLVKAGGGQRGTSPGSNVSAAGGAGGLPLGSGTGFAGGAGGGSLASTSNFGGGGGGAAGYSGVGGNGGQTASITTPTASTAGSGGGGGGGGSVFKTNGAAGKGAGGGGGGVGLNGAGSSGAAGTNVNDTAGTGVDGAYGSAGSTNVGTGLLSSTTKNGDVLVVSSTNGSTTFNLRNSSGTLVGTTVGTIKNIVFALVDSSNTASANVYQRTKSRYTVFSPAVLRSSVTDYAVLRKAGSFKYANTTANNIFDSRPTQFGPAVLLPSVADYAVLRKAGSFKYANTTANNIFDSRPTALPPIGGIITANSTTANSVVSATSNLIAANTWYAASFTNNVYYDSKATLMNPSILDTINAAAIYVPNSSIRMESIVGSSANVRNIFKYTVSSFARKSVVPTYVLTSGQPIVTGGGGEGNTAAQIWTTGT